MQKRFSLSDLARITGLRPRTPQNWAARGVLLADFKTERRGTGIARRFSFSEAMIACVIGQAARLQMPVGILFTAARKIRGSDHVMSELLKAVRKDEKAPEHLLIRFFLDDDESEEPGGGRCEILGPKTDKIQVGEVGVTISLNKIFDGLSESL